MSISIRRLLGASAALILGVSTLTACSSSDAAACETLKIGFFGAQTGDAGNLGINISRGAELAVQQYNAASPEVAVEYITFDSQGDPAQAPALAQNAVKDECLVGIVGPAFSGESAVANPIFEEVGLAIITPSATNPDLSKNGWDVFHRAVATDAIQGAAVVSMIQSEFSGAKVAVIDDAQDYGKGLADIVAAGLGADVVARESLDPKAQDFASTVATVKAAGATVVYYGGYYAEAGRLAKQLKDSGVIAQFISGDGSLDKGFAEAAGAAAAGAIVTAPTAPVSDISGGPEYAAAYKAAFGEDSGTYSAEAYDAANFLLAAISAGNTDRASILKYVNENSFTGLTKELKFDATGELTGGAIYKYTFATDGTFKGVLLG